MPDNEVYPRFEMCPKCKVTMALQRLANHDCVGRLLSELLPGDVIDGQGTQKDILVLSVEDAEPVEWGDESRPMTRFRGRMGRTLAWKVIGDPLKQDWQKAEHSWCWPSFTVVNIVPQGVRRAG